MRILLLLLSCLLHASCEKASDKREDDCGDTVTARLQLVPERPNTGCRIHVALHERDGELFYSVSHQLCYVEPAIYTCAGNQVCLGQECKDTFFSDARLIRELGWLPEPVDCGDDIVARLGLEVDVPNTPCPNRYDLLLVDGVYYYRITNIGPVCNSIVQVLSCDDEPVCVYAPDTDCSTIFGTDSAYVRLLGYL